MASHRVVTNGVVYEVEDGERLKPKGADEVELLKCGCTGNGCEDITIEPGGRIRRSQHRHPPRTGEYTDTVRVGLRAVDAFQTPSRRVQAVPERRLLLPLRGGALLKSDAIPRV